jgi:ketopantoate reductase
VGRNDEVELIGRQGISLESVPFGRVSARPAAMSELTTSSKEVLIVATKATALPAALQRIKVQPGLVVPLLNGLEHVAMLSSRNVVPTHKSLNLPAARVRTIHPQGGYLTALGRATISSRGQQSRQDPPTQTRSQKGTRSMLKPLISKLVGISSAVAITGSLAAGPANATVYGPSPT